MIKVCHISNVHNLHDPRILYRECTSLVNANFDVSLVIQADKHEIINGVKIIPLKKTNNRVYRMFCLTWVALFKALKTKSKIYHFRDPEFIFHGCILRLLGKKVVFDVHENISLQIKEKDWLPFNKVISKAYIVLDFIASKLFYLVLAEKSYDAHYKKFNAKSIIVYNYPDLPFFKEYINSDRIKRETNEIFYCGGVFHNRGFDVIIKALYLLKQKNIPFYFHCIGRYSSDYLNGIYEMPEYNEIKNQIKFYGYLQLNEAYEISKSCKVGLAILRPIGNYMNSYSTKNFEYMAIGLPTITSNFKLYTDIYDVYPCGICINPVDPKEMMDAMVKIFNNEDNIAKSFSFVGIEVSEKYFNWETESIKIKDLYNNLITN